MVAPAVEAPVVIGLDVGGTKILSGLVDREGNVHAEHEVPSPDGSEEGVLAALDTAVEALLDPRVAAIGYGIPANLERGTGRILRAVNLPLDDVDLVSRATERFGLPVGVENDAGAATLAEWRFGAGRGTQNLVMLTLGTGVGGGIVIDGRLFRGWAELGHIVVREGGRGVHVRRSRPPRDVGVGGNRRRPRRARALRAGCGRARARRAGEGGRRSRSRGARADRRVARGRRRARS